MWPNSVNLVSRLSDCIQSCNQFPTNIRDNFIQLPHNKKLRFFSHQLLGKRKHHNFTPQSCTTWCSFLMSPPWSMHPPCCVEFWYQLWESFLWQIIKISFLQGGFQPSTCAYPCYTPNCSNITSLLSQTRMDWTIVVPQQACLGVIPKQGIILFLPAKFQQVWFGAKISRLKCTEVKRSSADADSNM